MHTVSVVAAAAAGAADSEEEVEIGETVEDSLDDCRNVGVPTPLRQADSAERRRSAIRWQVALVRSDQSRDIHVQCRCQSISQEPVIEVRGTAPCAICSTMPLICPQHFFLPHIKWERV